MEVRHQQHFIHFLVTNLEVEQKCRKEQQFMVFLKRLYNIDIIILYCRDVDMEFKYLLSLFVASSLFSANGCFIYYHQLFYELNIHNVKWQIITHLLCFIMS